MNILTILKEKLPKNKNVDISNNNNKLITFLNPYSYLLHRKNPSIISQFDIIYIDGILLVYMLKIFSINSFRFSFDMTSAAPLVFKNTIEHNKSIYFIGSKENEIKEFIKKMKFKYSNLNIVGYKNGYFTNKKQTIKEIILINPDIIVTGLGTPLQEIFLLELREKGWNGTGYTCGGFFHQTAKGMNYYPEFYNNYNLRWLFRIIDEPKLFRRYFFKYPQAMFYFFLDLIMLRLKK